MTITFFAEKRIEKKKVRSKRKTFDLQDVGNSMEQNRGEYSQVETAWINTRKIGLFTRVLRSKLGCCVGKARISSGKLRVVVRLTTKKIFLTQPHGDKREIEVLSG